MKSKMSNFTLSKKSIYSQINLLVFMNNMQFNKNKRRVVYNIFMLPTLTKFSFHYLQAMVDTISMITNIGLKTIWITIQAQVRRMGTRKAFSYLGRST